MVAHCGFSKSLTPYYIHLYSPISGSKQVEQ